MFRGVRFGGNEKDSGRDGRINTPFVVDWERMVAQSILGGIGNLQYLNTATKPFLSR